MAFLLSQKPRKSTSMPKEHMTSVSEPKSLKRWIRNEKISNRGLETGRSGIISRVCRDKQRKSLPSVPLARKRGHNLPAHSAAAEAARAIAIGGCIATIHAASTFLPLGDFLSFAARRCILRSSAYFAFDLGLLLVFLFDILQTEQFDVDMHRLRFDPGTAAFLVQFVNLALLLALLAYAMR
ncbi:hypothetical protein ABW21_db0203046 [Orbilia brochopaga]|nr:hypothetical protein ABW21_db0203046 [Drechslerella brochopaga]